MSQQEGSGSGPGSGNSAPKAIANTTKRVDNVTRRGTTRMKFTPTLPARRKKEDAEPDAKEDSSAESPRGRGQGRGRARGRGRGDGRGGAHTGVQEMVASGPFAMGPAMSASSRRGAPRSNFAPVTPFGGSSSSSLGTGLTKTTAPSLKKEAGQTKVLDEDAYSEPDDGVEIIDIDDVRRMDWMAPESLRKEKPKPKKKEIKVDVDVKGKGKVKAEPLDAVGMPEEDQVDLANAIDLSESEEEEEMEDLINDFSLEEEMEMDLNLRQEKLFFFQFPEPFPAFASPELPINNNVGDSSHATDPSRGVESQGKGKKAVSFAPGVKPPAGSETPKVEPGSTKEGLQTQVPPTLPLDGVIGRLEIRKSGAVQMRLGDGILLDVTAATQPSFLQHAVHLDPETKRLSILGEVNRRFVVSPNVEALLDSINLAETKASTEVDKIADGMITMNEN